MLIAFIQITILRRCFEQSNWPQTGLRQFHSLLKSHGYQSIKSCKVKSQNVLDAVPCTNIPISWKNVIVPKTSLEDGDSMTVSCTAGYYLISGSGVVFCYEGVLSPSPSCIG